MLAWNKGETIAIWGTGLWGKRLFYKYRVEYLVTCFIDNSPRSREFYGVPVVHAKELNKLNCKILIAVQEYGDICVQCEKEGKSFYEDYLPYFLFEYNQIPIIPLYDLAKDQIKKFFHIFLQGKKSVLIIGNCQTSKIKPSMMTSTQFDKEYIFVDIPMVHLLTEHDISVLKHCKFIFEESCLIITQYISSEAGKILGTQQILNMKGNQTSIIFIPTLWFDCYYPQSRHQYRKVDLGKGLAAFPYADSMVDELINKYSVDKVIEIVKSPDLYSAAYLNDLYEQRITELSEREQRCDIKMLDFVIANWKTELLFFSVNHPNNRVIFEETVRILRFLGIEDFNSEKVDMTELDEFQELIYPSVQLNYGLIFQHDYYKDGSFHGKKTIDEYIREYIRYIHPQKFKM
ncbi:MAG: hypothetical protein HFH12_00755 [Dorea sp.]|nr:hypothetical protein [Dorea sp.]